MNRTFEVSCPNCGGSATRSYFTSQESRYSNCPRNQVIQVECADCDYLMVMCSVSGNVVEAYDSATFRPTRRSGITAKAPLSA
ncbi:MAG: replication restart DNA helicase PriA [Cyanobacteria bacterium J06631_6]